MESINQFADRQIQKYDYNRDGLIEPNGVPIVSPYMEGTGRARDYFLRNQSISFMGYGAVDRNALAGAVYRDIDLNHDGYISLPERIFGWLKTGLW